MLFFILFLFGYLKGTNHKGLNCSLVMTQDNTTCQESKVLIFPLHCSVTPGFGHRVAMSVCMYVREREKKPSSKIALLSGIFWVIRKFLYHTIEKLYFLCVKWKNFRHTPKVFSNLECFCGIWWKKN